MGNTSSTLSVEGKGSAKAKKLRKRKMVELFNYEAEDNKCDESKEEIMKIFFTKSFSQFRGFLKERV